MRGLIQRVSTAEVSIDGSSVGRIDHGILLFLGIEASDTEKHSSKMIHKVLNYRLFTDDAGRMNNSVIDRAGGVLVVSQFTLVADTRKGLRPGFSTAATPAYAKNCYDDFVMQLQAAYPSVASGVFGADMQVSLCNDGPVTFLLDI